jgi:type IV secretory pathway VirB4 component
VLSDLPEITRPHRETVRVLAATYPFVQDPGLGSAGIYIGTTPHGGGFYFDPYELYRRQVLTHPALLVIGDMGSGKSSLVKTYLRRSRALFQRGIWCLDPKGENGPLMRSLGAVSVKLGRGLSTRINPLEFVAGEGGQQEGAQVTLLSGLLQWIFRRPLTVEEQQILLETWQDLARVSDRAPDLPSMLRSLSAPRPELGRTLGYQGDAKFAEDCRPLALGMRALLTGPLAGICDGPTSPELRQLEDVVNVDLSMVLNTPAFEPVLRCASAWSAALISHLAGHQQLIFHVEEAWAVLQDLDLVRRLQAQMRLARATGVQTILVMHHLSDLRRMADEGTELHKSAEQMLALTQTQVIYRQSTADANDLRQLLGLNATEVERILHLRVGEALWRVNGRSFVVQHRVAPGEWDLIRTDAAMTASGSA